jgi:thiosulfate/3-mercaptopyruvate sulfurtransferase
MKKILYFSLLAFPLIACADIGIISPQDAKKLIDNPDAAKRPVVLDISGRLQGLFPRPSSHCTSLRV